MSYFSVVLSPFLVCRSRDYYWCCICLLFLGIMVRTIDHITEKLGCEHFSGDDLSSFLHLLFFWLFLFFSPATISAVFYVWLSFCFSVPSSVLFLLRPFLWPTFADFLALSSVSFAHISSSSSLFSERAIQQYIRLSLFDAICVSYFVSAKFWKQTTGL